MGHGDCRIWYSDRASDSGEKDDVVGVTAGTLLGCRILTLHVIQSCSIEFYGGWTWWTWWTFWTWTFFTTFFTVVLLPVMELIFGFAGTENPGDEQQCYCDSED